MKLRDTNTPTKYLGTCNGKQCYDKKGAQTVKNNAWKYRGNKLRIYYDRDCGYWHVTHNILPKSDYKKVIKPERRPQNWKHLLIEDE